MVSRSVLKPDKGKNADFWLKQTWRLDIVHYIRIWSSREGNMWYPSTFLYSNKVESTIHRLRRSPFLSRKEHRFSCFPLISFRMLALCKKRTFWFIPVICKDCTILSREWHNHSYGLMICFKALWSALKMNKSQTYNSTLSYIPTYSILLSTIRQQRPGCQ